MTETNPTGHRETRKCLTRYSEKEGRQNIQGKKRHREGIRQKIPVRNAYKQIMNVWVISV